MASIDQLIQDSIQVRDETIPGANSANRIGSLFLNISETFEQIPGVPLSKRLSINDIVIPRNTQFDLLSIDWSSIAAGQRGGIILLNYYLMFTIGVGASNNTKCLTYRSASLGFTFDTDGVINADFINIILFSDIINSVPATNTLVEAILAPYQTSNGVLMIEVDHSETGSGTASLRANGYIDVITQAAPNNAIFTLLP
jgi:hypothetical protein